MAGAQPTLTGITEDASRGGLFDRSNVANPVSGADITGTTINDSTITLSVSIDGTVRTGTFTTNQAADGTVSLVFENIGTGGTPTMGGGDPVTDGRLTNNNATLQLDLQSGTMVDINISELVTQDELTAAIAGIMTGPGVTTFLALTDVPNDYTGNAGRQLRVNTAETGLEFFLPNPSGVTAADFSSADDTVVAAAGTGTDLGTVSLEARPSWIGNTGRGDNVGSTAQQATTVTLAADTGLVLNRDSATGNITIQAATPAPPPAAAPTPSVPDPSSALGTPTAMERTVIYSPRGTDMVTAVEMVSVMGPSGPITITPATDVSITGGVGSVVIPEMAATPPGEYTVNARVTTTSTDGETTTTDESSMIDRFIPYYQSRTEPMTEADITGGTISTEGWTRILVTGYYRQYSNANPTLFISADSADLPQATAFVNARTILLYIE